MSIDTARKFYCSACRKECEPRIYSDNDGLALGGGGLGATSSIYVDSDCCRADLFDDPEFTEPTDLDEYLYERKKEFENERY